MIGEVNKTAFCTDEICQQGPGNKEDVVDQDCKGAYHYQRHQAGKGITDGNQVLLTANLGGDGNKPSFQKRDKTRHYSPPHKKFRKAYVKTPTRARMPLTRFRELAL